VASNKGVLVDITKCVGCESCVVACRLYNGLNEATGMNNGSGKEQPAAKELAPDRWTVVKEFRVDKSGEPVRRFVKKQCFHCLEPACASACFAKALQKTPEGPVVYNEKLCVGCRYCMLACPFGVLRFEWDKAFPRVLKCQMCLSRVAKDQMPACASVCPTGALTFGERDKLIAEAKSRIASNPNLYVDHIFGNEEVGGTSWLYISDVPFDRLGFRTNVVNKPLPEYPEKVLRLTPAVALGWGALLTGMYYYTKRRDENENEKTED
jgi:formate dehydrogenase iron-sulfur subunit